MEVYGSFEGLGWNVNPFINMLDTYGFDQMSASSGMTSYPADTWGPTFQAVKQVHSRILSVNTVSSDFAEWPFHLGLNAQF